LEKEKTHIKKVAVVYHYFAHYRLPILEELSKSKDVDYTFFSDITSGIGIKTIDPKLADLSLEKGGLSWKFVKNKWLYKHLFLWQKGLLKLALKGDYDTFILLGNIFYISTWLAVLILKMRKKKVYFWTHGVTNDSKGIKWLLRKTFYNLSDGLMLYGKNAKDVMIKNGFNPSKLHVIYNSLDYKKQLKYREKSFEINTESIRNQLFADSKLPLVVFVGRLTFQKKLEMIVEVSKLLHEKEFKINTLFIGDGVAKQNLEALVTKYDLTNFFNFYGACYDESELCKLIYTSDICVSPGEVGLTVITSLGFGTPVITHGDFNYQMPEYEAIVPSISGDFFKRDSIADLAVKIRNWVETHKELPKSEISKNCYTVIDEKFNPLVQRKIINSIILNDE